MVLTILTLFLIPTALAAGIIAVRLHDQEQRDRTLKAYKLQFPQDLDIERVTAWLHSISGTLRPRLPSLLGSPTMALEAWSQGGSVSWRLLVPWTLADHIVGQLRTAVPGINAVPDTEFPRRRWTYAVEASMTVPTRQLQVGNPADASASLLESMNKIETDEAVVMQWVITPSKRQHLPVHGEVRTHHVSAKRVLKGDSLAGRDEVTDRRDKLAEPNMQAVLRVAAHANTKIRAKHLVFNVRRSLSARASAGTGFKSRMATLNELQKRIDNNSAPLRFPMQLSLTELASLIAWPIGNPNVAGLPPSVARHIAPTDAVARTGRILGMSNMPGRERPVALEYVEARKHMWCCSATGAGKTTLLANMFKQDVEAGYGAFLIESKGDLFQAALDYIPANRRQDVIVLDLNNVARPVGLNLLDQGNPEHVIDELSLMFEKMYQGNRGVWTRSVMYFGLKALTSDPKYTLLDLAPLLSPQTDAEISWRSKLVAGIKDESVKQWFDRFDKQTPTKKEQIIQPVMDRIWELSRPKIAPILGQSQSSFKMADVVKNNKILLVNLSGVERDSANLFGSLLVNAYWYAVKTAPPVEKTNFVYMDEFQSFVDVQTDFADLLAKARSFNCGMVMANQHMGQLSGELQDALMHNARTKVVFNASGQDARAFANEFGGMVSPEEMTRLSSYQAVAKVASGGSVTAPFTLVTNPPAAKVGLGNQIRTESLQTYGRDIHTVQSDMVARRQAGPAASGGNKPRFSASDGW